MKEGQIWDRGGSNAEKEEEAREVYEEKEKGALLSNRERGKERAPSSLPKERLSSCPYRYYIVYALIKWRPRNELSEPKEDMGT